MKKLISTLLFLGLIGFVYAQTIIENPKYGISNTNYLNLTKVELTPTATILSFTVKIPPHEWISVHEKSFIQPVGDTTKLYLTKGEGIEIYKNINWEEGKDKISYRLFFPKLKASVNKIDFGEPIQHAWKIFDIEVREQPYNSILPKQFLGSWFSSENGNWAFSFYDSIAVYDNKSWNYASVKLLKDISEITLKKDDQQKQIFLKTISGSSCVIGLTENDFQQYTKVYSKSHKDTATFRVQVLEPGKVVYRGLIHGFTTRMDLKTGLIQFFNRLTNSMETHLIKIAQDGSFHVEFQLAFPQLMTIILPSGNEQVFFEPGKDLFELINSGIKEHSSLFMGESAEVNYGLQATGDISNDIVMTVPEITKMNQNEYNDKVMTLKKEELEKLKKIQSEQSICAKAIQIRNLDIEYRAARNILNFNQNIRNANFYANRKLKENEQQPFIPRKVDTSLLDILKDSPVNSKLALLSSEYLNLLQALKFTDFVRPQGPFYYWLSVLSSQLENKKAEITPEEKEMLEFSRTNLCDSFDDNKAKTFNTIYGPVVQKFLQKYNTKYPEISNSWGKENLNSNLKLIFGSQVGLPDDMNTLQTFLQKINAPSAKLDENEFKKVKSEINTDYVKEYAISEYYKKKTEEEVNESVSSNELKTEGDKLFDSLIKKFRGKVIFVDFWATWCGPCRQGIEEIKPLKDELVGKDVAFVYITNPSSPEKAYNEMKPNIKGEHFRVSDDEWNYLTQKFTIYGIPHYALVDKNGKIVNPDLNRMDNESLKKNLIDQVNN